MNIRIINSNFSLIHPIEKDLCRKNVEITDAFKDKYSFYNVVSLPDNVEPIIPRIIMRSNNGHSQISFALNNINLKTQYSDDYVSDYDKCSKYMFDRTNKIFEVLNKIGLGSVLYISLKTRVIIPMSCNPTKYLLEKFNSSNILNNDLTDLQEMLSFKKNDRYFVNINFGNYRRYKTNANLAPESQVLQYFRNSKVLEQGITIDFEINNRYYYNFKGEISNDDIIKDKNFIYNYTSDFINKKIYSLLDKGAINI